MIVLAMEVVVILFSGNGGKRGCGSSRAMGWWV